MKTWIAVALLAIAASSLVQAQDVTRNPPPQSVKRAQQGQATVVAPVGHVQPRPLDGSRPAGSSEAANVEAQDRELDRMIKGICRGC